MKILIQSLFLSVFLLSGCASTEVKPEKKLGPSLNEAQLKSLLIGHTLIGHDNGKQWTDFFHPNGQLDGAFESSSDKGTYTLKGTLFCSEWKNWRNGSKACWTFHKRPNGNYDMKLHSGPSQSYVVQVK